MSGIMQVILAGVNKLLGFTTPALMNGSTSVAYMNSVTVNSSGLFVAVGRNGSDYPLYATSSNGSTWTTPALMNGSTTIADMVSVTVNSSGLFVAVGNSGGQPSYATSTNGSTWTTPAPMVSGVYGAAGSVTVNSSGLFVAMGTTTTGYPTYATSTNGSTWTTPAVISGSSNNEQMNSVAVNSSGLFVAVGKNGNGYPLYTTSSNGSTWTAPTLIGNEIISVTTLDSVTVNSSGLFVVVGIGNLSGYDSPVFATSSNGSTWTTLTSMNGSTTYARMRSVTVNNSGLFVAVGFSSAGYPLYATST